MTLDPSLNEILLILATFGIAFMAALWFSLIIWTFRDMQARSRNFLARTLATLIVAALFLPGLLIYLILRPHRTIEDEYRQALEEAALLETIGERSNCPSCGRKISAEWIVCPICHTRLKNKCRNCSELMELTWNLCPHCTTPTQGIRRNKISPQVAPPIEATDSEITQKQEPSQKIP